MITPKHIGFVKDAIFLSNTSLRDFIKCPRAYYLKNIYKDPRNGYRIQIASPYLTLGTLVHETIKWFLDSRQQLPLSSLEEQYRNLWHRFQGKRGGFTSKEEEASFGKRGLEMLSNFGENWKKLEAKMPPVSFPKYPLTDNIILTGNMDFVGQNPDETLHVVDFKTGTRDEDDPIQLYIYAILAENNYGKDVTCASFWYLDRDDTPKDIVLDPLEPKIEELTQRGLEIEKGLKEGKWECPRGDEGCFECRDYEKILAGKGEWVFTDHNFKKEIFFLSK